MKIITIEEHANIPLGQVSKEAMDKIAKDLGAGKSANSSFTPTSIIVEQRIADMDKNRIDFQILSNNIPQTELKAESISQIKLVNDTLAEAVKAHPDRFGAFSTLPLSAPGAAAEELQRVVSKFGFKGGIIFGRPGETFLDDPAYSPLLETAQSLNVPLYIHPGLPIKSVKEAYYDGFAPAVSNLFATAGWGWHVEAGVQIIRMILAGVFDKFPNLQVISGHWGELVPYYLTRLDWAFPSSLTKLERKISEYYTKNVTITPSGIFSTQQLLFALEVVGADRIIYSVDTPYVGNEGAREFLEKAPISQADKEKIAHGNAEKLFRL